MSELEPTPPQKAFVDEFAFRKLFFGSRQIGKTTALAFDAVDSAMDSQKTGPFAVTAPTMRQGRTLVDRCKEVALEQCDGIVQFPTSTEITLPTGSTISYVPTGDFYMDRGTLNPSRAHEFEEIFVDEIDFVDSGVISALEKSWNDGEVRGLSFAGTARTDSPAIKRLAKGDDWFSVYQTLYSSELSNGRDIDAAMDMATPEQAVTEYKGLFVSDPADDADVVNGDHQ